MTMFFKSNATLYTETAIVDLLWDSCFHINKCASLKYSRYNTSFHLTISISSARQQ